MEKISFSKNTSILKISLFQYIIQFCTCFVLTNQLLYKGWPLSAQATRPFHLNRTRASMRTLILATR